MDGRVVVVTGGGRGMGAAIARGLARRGWRVVLGARSEDEIAVVAAEIRHAGGEAVHRRADVTALPEVQGLVALAADRYGRLDAVVANAGVAVNAPIADGDPADWDRMIDVNLRGVLHVMAAAVPVFRWQGHGHLVVIGSTSATKWVPGQGVYAASKAGVRAVTGVLRQELAPDGVRTTLVSPGFTATAFVDGVRDDGERAVLQARRDAIAMPPEAVADAVAYALEQPDGVDVGELVVRPTVQP